MTFPAGADARTDAPLVIIGDVSEPTPNVALTMDPSDPNPKPTSTFFRNAWWRVKVPETQWVALDLDLSVASYQDADTYLSVWWLNPDTKVLQLVKADDDSGVVGFHPKVVFKAGANATYWIQAACYEDPASDVDYVLRAATSAPVPYPDTLTNTGPLGSNAFADAPVILAGSQVSSTASSAYNLEAGEPALNTTDTRSAWWTFTPTTSGLVRLVATSGVSVWTGDDLASLTLVGYRHNNNSTVYMRVEVQAGITYRIRVSTASASNFWLYLYTVIPCRALDAPAYLVEQRGTSGTEGEIVGGPSALSEMDDTTYVRMKCWNETAGATNTARTYQFSLSPTDFDPAADTLLDVQLVIRGYKERAGNLPAPGWSLITSGGSSGFYNPYSFNHKTGLFHTHFMSLRNASDVLQVSNDMVVKGSDAAYPPAGWSSPSYPRFDWRGYLGTNPPAEWAVISYTGLRTYVFEDTYPVEPPDVETGLVGRPLSGRRGFKGMRR